MSYFATLLCLAGQELAVAQKLKLPNPLVVNGEAFINPVYESHDAARLNIMHKTGAASLPIAQLPNELPNKLGYNRSNALAAEEQILKRKEEAETQSQIELSKILEKEVAASRRADIVDRKAGRSHVPTALPPPERTSSTPPPPQRTVAPRPTPHPSSIAAVQQEFSEFVERRSLPQSSTGSADSRPKQETALPNQPWMGNFDASSARLKLFQNGFLPLKRSEAQILKAGGELSEKADVTALDAFKAAKVMLGQLGPEQLPPAYKRLLTRPTVRGAPPRTRATAMGDGSMPIAGPRKAAGDLLGKANEDFMIRHERSMYDMQKESQRWQEDRRISHERNVQDLQFGHDSMIQQQRRHEDWHTQNRRQSHDANVQWTRDMNDATRQMGGMPTRFEPTFYNGSTFP